MIKLILTEKDFENAQRFYERERLKPINEENLFRAGIHCILSAIEFFQKHKTIQTFS